MKKLKKVASTTAATSMIFAVMSPVFAEPVDTSNYEGSAAKLGALDIMVGYNGNFDPEGLLTRAQAAKLIAAATGSYQALNLGEQKVATKFSDVPSTYWASGVIDYIARKGTIQGYMGGKKLLFNPEGNVTYGQFATMLLRALGYTDADVTGTWPDNYVNKAKDLGLFPAAVDQGQNVKRADAAVLVDKFLTSRSKKEEAKGTTGKTMFEQIKPALRLSTISGVITDVKDDKITINGNSYTIGLEQKTEFTGYVGRFAKVNVNENDKVVYVETVDNDMAVKYIDLGITVEPQAGTVSIEDMKTLKLTPRAIGYDGNEIKNIPFTYSSSDETVGKVDADGTITGVGKGNATIAVKTTSSGKEIVSYITVKVTKDEVAPIVTVTGVTSGGVYNTPVTPMVEVNEPDSTIRMTVDGAVYQPNMPLNLSDGEHTIIVNATDRAGNVSADQVIRFTMDTKPPVISDISIDYAANKATFTVDEPNLASVRVMIDNQEVDKTVNTSNYSVVGSTYSVVGSTYATTYTVPLPSTINAIKTLSVIASDKAGNLSTKFANLVPPGLTIKSIPSLAPVTTTAGVYPTLPTTVTGIMNDNTERILGISWETIASSVYANPGTFTATGTVVGYNYAVTVPVTVIPTALAVSSITAINPKQVEIKFNKAVDSSKVLTSNFVVYAQGATTNLVDGTGADATLLSDGMTVRLTLEDGASLANYTTTNVVTVKSAIGLAADYTKSDVSLFDTSVPQLMTAEATGPREITLTFSEPVQGTLTNASFDIDGKLLTYNITPTFVNSKSQMKLYTYSDLTAGSHTIKLNAGSGITDYSGFPAVPKEMSFTYAAPTAAPTVTLQSSTESTATIKFSRPVTNLMGNTKVLFRHSFNSPTYQVDGTAVTNPSGDNQTFVVDFGSKPFPPGTTQMFMVYADGTLDSEKITDAFGNKVAPTTFTITTVVDITKPQVTAVAFVDATHVKVSFSKDVDATTATTTSNYTLKDSSGNTIAVNSAAFDTNSTKDIILTTDTLNGGTYTLQIANVKDRSIAQNVMDTVTKTFTATDVVPPTIVDLLSGAGTSKDALQIDTTYKKVLIRFSEPMNKSSIEDSSNYSYASDGSTFSNLPSDTTLTASADLRSVTIDFPDTTTVINGTSVVNVGRVKDASNNQIAALFTPVTVQNGVTLAPTSVQATEKNKIKLTFAGTISGINASDFAVDIDGTGSPTDWKTFSAVTNVSYADGNTYITLQTQDNMATGGWTSTADGPIVRSINGGTPTVQAAASTTKDEFGRKVNFEYSDNTNIGLATDVIPPELVADASNPIVALNVDNDSGKKIDHIRLTFTEKISAGTVSADKFTVTGYTVDDAYTSTSAPTSATDRTGATVADSTTVYLRISKTNQTTDLTATPTVTIASTVKDTKGNSFAGVTTKSTTPMAKLTSTDLTAIKIIKGTTGYELGAGTLATTGAKEVYVTFDGGTTFYDVASAAADGTLTPIADAIPASIYIAGKTPRYLYVNADGSVSALSDTDGTILTLSSATTSSTIPAAGSGTVALTFNGNVTSSALVATADGITFGGTTPPDTSSTVAVTANGGASRYVNITVVPGTNPLTKGTTTITTVNTDVANSIVDTTGGNAVVSPTSPMTIQ